MGDDLWAWLLNRVGHPIPCGLCGVPTPAEVLTECRIPSALTDWGVVVDRLVWLCPCCPVVDAAA